MVVSSCPPIATYNVNALSEYATSPASRARKNRVRRNLEFLAKTNSHLCIQETKLNAKDHQALKSTFPGWDISYSNCPGDARKAGVVTLTCPAVLADFEHSRVPLPSNCEGYVLVSRFDSKASRHRSYTLINVYNPQSAAGKVAILKVLCGLSLTEDIFMVGDFNFVERPEDAASAEGYVLTADLEANWTRLLSKLRLTEISQDTHTFLRRVEGRVVSARLDRIYSSLMQVDLALAPPRAFIPHVPFSILPRLRGDTSTSQPGPDHVPVGVCFDSGRNYDRAERKPIPRWLAGSVEFKAALQQRVSGALVGLPPFEALEMFKGMVNEVAKEVSIVFKSKSAVTSTLGKISVALSLLRALAARKLDQDRIRSMLIKHHFLAGLVVETSAGWVCTGLREQVERLINEQIGEGALQDGGETHFGASFVVGPTASKHCELQDIKARLPSERGRLPGLRTELGDDLATEPEEMAKVAEGYYAKLWDARAVESRARAGAYIDGTGFAHRIPEKLVPVVPNVDDVINVILSTNNSCAGPDGVPFCAYRAVAEEVAPVFRDIIVALGSGVLPPSGFNDGLLFLLSKKGTLTPVDTRPLSVTNTDNRIIAKIVIIAIVPAVQDLLHLAQQGFTAGRSGDGHIRRLMDYFYSALKQGKSYHVLQVDTERAFDSVDHPFILAALQRSGFPEWIINVVTGLLDQVRVTPFFGKRTSVWIRILRGVKQGCPLSPVLFCICFNILICDLEKRCPALDAFAFADDLALGCVRREPYRQAMLQMNAFGDACGARPNMTKSSLTSVRQRLVRDADWVLSCPWTNLATTTSNVYLGILYGNKVNTSGIFAGPFVKATGRLNKFHMVLRGMSIAMRIVVVNVFVISVFSYLANYYPFPFPDVGAIAGSLYGKFMAAVRRAVLPFNGCAAKYHHLIMPRSRFGAAVQLRDLWAMVTATLGAKYDLRLLHGLPRSHFIGRSGLGLHGSSSSLMVTDSYANAAKDFVIATMAADVRLGEFDAAGYMELPVAKRRKVIYDKLVLAGYAQDQDDDLARLLHKRGVGKTVGECYSYVARLHANVSALPITASRSRRYIFAVVTNAVPTERRRMVIALPHKATRDAAPRVPCFVCGKYDDGVYHVHSTCAPVQAALRKYMTTLRLDLPDSPPLHLALFIFEEVDKVVVAAVASFNASVRSQIAGFFATLGSVMEGEDAAARLYSSAIHDWSAGSGVTGLGSAGRRSEAQKRKCQRYGEEVMRRLPTDAWVCYIDGSAKPNPGPCGTGVALFAGTKLGTAVFEASIPLGAGSNNIGELWGFGCALQKAIGLSMSGELRPDQVYAVISDSRHSLSGISGMQIVTENKSLVQCIRGLVRMVSGRCDLRLIWFPGHVDLYGNERADDLAGKAAIISSLGYSTDRDARCLQLNFL